MSNSFWMVNMFFAFYQHQKKTWKGASSIHKSITIALSLHSGQLLDVADLLSPTYGFSQSRFLRGSINHRGRREQQKERRGCIIFLNLLLLFFPSFPSPQLQCLYWQSACYARGSQMGGCHAQLLLPKTLHCPQSPRLLFSRIWMIALGTGPGESISLSHCPAQSHCGCATAAVSGSRTVCNPLLGK